MQCIVGFSTMNPVHMVTRLQNEKPQDIKSRRCCAIEFLYQCSSSVGAYEFDAHDIRIRSIWPNHVPSHFLSCLRAALTYAPAKHPFIVFTYHVTPAQRT